MSMYPIASYTVGAGGATNISFASIPQTFTHLQIRMFAANASAADFSVYFNSDTATNYVQHNLYGDGSSAATYFYGTGANSITFAFPFQGIVSSTSFASVVMDVLDYTNTNKNKTTRAIGGIDRNGSGLVALESGLWRSTAAVSSINVSLTAGTFVQYSRFDLYGIQTSNATGA